MLMLNLISTVKQKIFSSLNYTNYTERDIPLSKETFARSELSLVAMN